MQQLTAAPRDSLTIDQVTNLLVGAADVTYDRGLELLDASLNVVADLTDWFEGGTVTRTMAATVHGACSLTVAGDAPAIAYGSQLVRPYMTISDGTITARFNAGVFRIARPQADYSTTPGSLPLTGSDRLSLLDRAVGDAYTVAKSSQVLAAVLAAVTAAGLDASTVRLDATKASAILPADKTWPLLVDTSVADVQSPDVTADSSNATTWLRIINDLLEIVGYRGLWADQDGYFRSSPYVTPSARPIEFAFDFDDELLSVIDPSRTVNIDQSDPVNVWVFLQSNLVDGSGNSVEPVEGTGQYTRTNENYGPTSIDAQGGLQWVSVIEIDAADQATLQALGDAQVDAALSAAVTYSATIAPFPVAGHEDIYSYADAAVLGGTNKVQCTAWTLDLGSSTTPPADTTMTWETVTTT